MLVCGFSVTNLFWSSLQYSNASCLVNLLAVLQACAVFAVSSSALRGIFISLLLEFEQTRKKRRLACKLRVFLCLLYCLIHKNINNIWYLLSSCVMFSSTGHRVRTVRVCREVCVSKPRLSCEAGGELEPRVHAASRGQLMFRLRPSTKRHLQLQTQTEAKGNAALPPRLLGRFYYCCFSFPSWWMCRAALVIERLAATRTTARVNIRRSFLKTEKSLSLPCHQDEAAVCHSLGSTAYSSVSAKTR